MRKFVADEIMPYVHQWDEARAIPMAIFKKAYEAGWLPGIIGKSWPVKYAGSNIAGGVKPEEYDAFHELIIIDEVSRSASAGVAFSLLMALDVGLPPVMHFGLGAKEKQERICRECLTGEKNICLAITEPGAGSDVANLCTTATLTSDGKYYVVNGEKKWITGGTFADYFTVAVRTSKGMGGLSLLLIERGPGVTTRQMACSGAWSGGTAYVTFEDVKVPVANLIGEENKGFKYIMHNFNHERWSLIIQALRFARVCYEEAFKYAHKRKTFGKRLIDHPVIRAKLAHMVRQIEATQCWLEQITYQMNTMTYEESRILGGPLALLKAHTSSVFEFCAREAAQILGGLAYTRGGQGEKIERLQREVRGYAIPGGSEEILFDFGIRQAMRAAKL